MTDIVAFASSLRRGSFNRALVEEGRQLPPDGMTIEPIEIGSMPFHNADVEADGDPASVTAYKQALHEADGLIIATPEYNDGVPVVLTNAVDWGARLLGRAQLHLRQLFGHVRARVLPPPELLVAPAHQQVDANLEPDRRAGQGVLADLLARFAGSPRAGRGRGGSVARRRAEHAVT